MALMLYTGTPGSGKSLHIVKEMLFQLRCGKDVIANFPLLFTDEDIKKGYDKRFYYMTSTEITVNRLLEHAIDHDYIEKKKESQCFVVIDEAGGRFNTRNVGATDRTEWIDFFSQHRKLGYDFVLICQSDGMIDRQIRRMVETEFVHRKINNYGLFFLLPFALFVSIERWYVAKERVAASYFRYKKKYGERYDTMKMFESFKMSPELLRKIEEKKAKQAGQQVQSEPIDVSDVPAIEIFEKESTNEGPD